MYYTPLLLIAYIILHTRATTYHRPCKARPTRQTLRVFQPDYPFARAAACQIKLPTAHVIPNVCWTESIRRRYGVNVVIDHSSVARQNHYSPCRYALIVYRRKIVLQYSWISHFYFPIYCE
jgi:hypothetical protein